MKVKRKYESGCKGSVKKAFEVQNSKVGDGRRNVRHEIMWVNHWVNWNNCLIYEAKILNQVVSTSMGRIGVLQSESIVIKSP